MTKKKKILEVVVGVSCLVLALFVFKMPGFAQTKSTDAKLAEATAEVQAEKTDVVSTTEQNQPVVEATASAEETTAPEKTPEQIAQDNTVQQLRQRLANLRIATQAARNAADNGERGPVNPRVDQLLNEAEGLLNQTAQTPNKLVPDDLKRVKDLLDEAERLLQEEPPVPPIDEEDDRGLLGFAGFGGGSFGGGGGGGGFGGLLGTGVVLGGIAGIIAASNKSGRRRLVVPPASPFAPVIVP